MTPCPVLLFELPSRGTPHKLLLEKSECHTRTNQINGLCEIFHVPVIFLLIQVLKLFSDRAIAGELGNSYDDHSLFCAVRTNHTPGIRRQVSCFARLLARAEIKS